MKYVVDKNNSEFKLAYYNVKMVGLDVMPKNGSNSVYIKASKLVLIDQELKDSYIKQRINRKIDRVIKFMIHILNDDDTTEEDTGLVLDEINKLKGIIINKYKEHMKESDYKSILTKLIIIEEEFKKNYNQKIIMNNFMPYYEEDYVGNRSR